MARSIALLFCFLSPGGLVLATPPYFAETMPQFTTNRVFSATVASNWLVITVLEPPVNFASFSEPALYARPLPSNGRSFQRIALNPSKNSAFGLITTIHGDTLITKDGNDTYFFRDNSGTWVPDGKISGDQRPGAAGGPLLAEGGYLISGSELYEWPSRKYLQTFSPMLWNAVFVGSKLAITYPIEAIPGVWLFENVNGVWTNPERLVEPFGTAESRFGLNLARTGGFLFIAAPEDDEGAPNSGAVHAYFGGANGDTWFYHQKIKPMLPMAGDGFGAAMAVEDDQVYIAAPYRNEERQHSGAIFVFQIRANRSAISIREIAKVTLKDTYDGAALGLRLAVRDSVIYGLIGQQSSYHPTSVVAFHPTIELVPSHFSQVFGITLNGNVPNGAVWQTSSDLNREWQFQSATDAPTNFQMTLSESARFFRVQTPSGF